MADSIRDLPPLLIRADASADIGIGHVMRCLALAQQWRTAGGEAIFALHDVPPALQERLQAEQCHVQTVDASAGSLDDARETSRLARERGCQWIVLDGYHFDRSYEQAMKQDGPKVLAIDDFRHADHAGLDLVLNQNVSATRALYADRTPARLLLGPAFALLRHEFHQAHRRAAVSTATRRVLVTLGGADPHNVTQKVIDALEQANVEGLEAVVIAGGANRHRHSLASSIARTKAPIALVSDVREMPQWMQWADIAVAAGGSSVYELALLGVPALMIVIADNQRPIAAACEAAGWGSNLGWHADLSPETIASALAHLLTDKHARDAMACQGRTAIDGRGAARVVRAMRGERIAVLRPVARTDARRLWEWANDPVVRSASFHQQPIPWEDHERWLETRLSTVQLPFYIAHDEMGEPIGQVRFDASAEGPAISVSLGAAARGQGWGVAVIRAACEAAFLEMAGDVILAHVSRDDKSVLNAYSQAGFARIGDAIVGEQPAYCYRLMRCAL